MALGNWSTGAFTRRREPVAPLRGQGPLQMGQQYAPGTYKGNTPGIAGRAPVPLGPIAPMTSPAMTPHTGQFDLASQFYEGMYGPQMAETENQSANLSNMMNFVIGNQGLMAGLMQRGAGINQQQLANQLANMQGGVASEAAFREAEFGNRAKLDELERAGLTRQGGYVQGMEGLDVERYNLLRGLIGEQGGLDQQRYGLLRGLVSEQGGLDQVRYDLLRGLVGEDRAVDLAQQALAEKLARQGHDVDVRALESEATARGAMGAPGTRGKRQDIGNVLAGQLEATGLTGKESEIGYRRDLGQLDIGKAEQGLGQRRDIGLLDIGKAEHELGQRRDIGTLDIGRKEGALGSQEQMAKLGERGKVLDIGGEYREELKGLHSKEQARVLDNAAKEYGLNSDELKLKLEEGLAKLNLDTVMNVGDLMDALSGKNIQMATLAEQIIRDSVNTQGMFPTPTIPGVTPGVPRPGAAGPLQPGQTQIAPAKLQGMQPAFRQSVEGLVGASNGRVTVSSGFRSNTKQADLWQQALKKYGSPAAARKWVAPPGHSKHEHGQAVDFGGDLELAAQLAPQYGLYQPLKNEPWHWEPIGSRGKKK